MILICISLRDNDVEDFLHVSAICASYSEQPARVCPCSNWAFGLHGSSYVLDSGPVVGSYILVVAFCLLFTRLLVERKFFNVTRSVINFSFHGLKWWERVRTLCLT